MSLASKVLHLGPVVLLSLLPLHGPGYAQRPQAADSKPLQPRPANSKDFDRGVKALGKGDNDLAIKYFDAVIRAKQNDAAAFLYRGLAYFRKKDYTRALKDYTEAIRLEPKNPASHLRRGLAHDRKMQSEEAVKDYTEAIRLESNNPKAYILRAVVYAKLRLNRKAIKDCNEAIHLDPKNASSYVMRGIAHADEREYEKAAEDYTKALSLEPNSFLAYNKFAWLQATCPRVKLRDGRKALEGATKACELSNWDDARNLEALAAAYAEIGKFVEAVKWQKRALENWQYGKEEAAEARMRLRLYQDRKPYRELDRP
jgi:tetratricopeptide (TPR) repeat protein